MPSYNKKDFKESNVNYLNKDFSSLKGSLVNYAKSYFPNTYRDFNETSPGMMLIEMSAYVGDVLSFYIDQQYREMMLPLAEERRNVVNMANMLGYKVKPIAPAYVDLTFTSEVNADSDDASKIDYTDAAVWNTDIKVSSLINSDLVFETLDEVDFTISQSTDTNVVRTKAPSGLASSYTLSRTVRAVSAETKTKTFSVTSPTKFLKLTISDTNVIDIISTVDTNGNKWYEVDYLAQDKVPIPTHYTQDIRTNAYYNLDNTQFTTDVPVPYSLQYIKTSKRFIRETNEDNTTSLIFGNGILKNGTTLDAGFLDLEQAGIIIPGQTSDLATSIDPLLGDEYSTLGETPIQTTLTVTYRVGGGITSNASMGDLTSFTSPTPLSDNSSTDASLLTVTNNIPARGGKDREDVDEIREKTKAFFTTQQRCVTKEDYEARIMNIPSKYGNIAKVYVSREEGASSGVGTSLAALQTFINDVQTYITSVGTTQLNIGQYVDNTAADSTSTDTLFDIHMSDTPIIPDIQTIVRELDLGTIKIHILSYDKNKNLVGNPVAPLFTPSLTDNIPTILKNNVSNYIDNFRLLTDTIELLDGFIINFGVFFDVVVHKFANKSEVKLKCIEKIKDYFNINKMQFSQPIYVSQLEYELMGIDGVRAVNYVTITQEEDWNAPAGSVAPLSPATFKYSVADITFDSADDVTISSTGDGYGWLYNFEDANENGVILPPSPDTPGIFELKNPNQNIRGVVR
jgi:hypothetical protein